MTFIDKDEILHYIDTDTARLSNTLDWIRSEIQHSSDDRNQLETLIPAKKEVKHDLSILQGFRDWLSNARAGKLAVNDLPKQYKHILPKLFENVNRLEQLPTSAHPNDAEEADIYIVALVVDDINDLNEVLGCISSDQNDMDESLQYKSLSNPIPIHPERKQFFRASELKRSFYGANPTTASPLPSAPSSTVTAAIPATVVPGPAGATTIPSAIQAPPARPKTNALKQLLALQSQAPVNVPPPTTVAIESKTPVPTPALNVTSPNLMTPSQVNLAQQQGQVQPGAGALASPAEQQAIASAVSVPPPAPSLAGELQQPPPLRRYTRSANVPRNLPTAQPIEPLSMAMLSRIGQAPGLQRFRQPMPSASSSEEEWD